ncbi:hypothetical protein AB4Z46_33840 [Variovorax sp. M-6]|uniref:hypothetical protein n=1 Tax=Variovorax sp. M-6 TaxID=3233041 RepID=UPI003F9C1353
MPMDYLRRIENAEFPLSVTDINEIGYVAILKAAGLVEAAVPLPYRDPDGTTVQAPAIVAEITQKGREELARLRGSPPSP